MYYKLIIINQYINKIKIILKFIITILKVNNVIKLNYLY